MIVTIEVRAKPEKYHELYQTLQALLPTLRSEVDFIDSRIYRMWKTVRYSFSIFTAQIRGNWRT
jgi:hypothetical protein